jgi:hypothetical protein
VSKNQRTKKPARGNPQANRRTGDPITDALTACTDAQAHLSRAEELSRKWQDHRRETIRQAFSAGVPVKEIASAVQVSQAKIYQLIGSARALKNG